MALLLMFLSVVAIGYGVAEALLVGLLILMLHTRLLSQLVKCLLTQELEVVQILQKYGFNGTVLLDSHHRLSIRTMNKFPVLMERWALMEVAQDV